MVFKMQRRGILFFNALKQITFGVIILITTLAVTFHGSFKKKSNFPTAVIFSLSLDQVFYENSTRDLFASIGEKRFSEFFENENPLIQVRSLRTILARKRNVTIDATLNLVSNCLIRAHYPSLIKEIFKSLLTIRASKNHSLFEFKKMTLDSSFCKIIIRDDRVKIDFVTTNSMLSRLPYFFESPIKGRRVALWYSTNNEPMTFRGVPTPTNWNIDEINSRIDTHLVWTNDDVKFLKSLGISSVYSVGSILFQPKPINREKREVFTITYFDITPLSPRNYWIVGSHELFNSEANALSDLCNFIEFSNRLFEKFGHRVEVRIKPKRASSRKRSEKYIAKITEIAGKGEIKILDAGINLYQTVYESDLVIATPWTSPAILAKELSVLSVFFSTRNEDWELPPVYRGLKVLKSQPALLEFATTHIGDKFSQ